MTQPNRTPLKIDSTKRRPWTAVLLAGAALTLGTWRLGFQAAERSDGHDVDLAVLQREQTDADLAPAQFLDPRTLDGIETSSTRLVGAHGDVRFFVGLGTEETRADPLLCFFTDYSGAPVLCGSPERYAAAGGELWYGKGYARLVLDTHHEPGEEWVQVEPNLYVTEAAPTAEADR